MKKIVRIIMCLLLVCSVAACSNNSDSTAKTADSSSKEQPETTQQNALIVYYSATGNTENIANYIADVTGGDLFELEPVEPYSDEDLNWNDENSRVVEEHEDESKRDIELVSTTVDNWESYDVVYIGYPIWWGIAAWPVNGFIEANDFEGKTVIPFCTSSSSSFGESGKLLEEMAGSGNWLEGERFTSSTSESEVETWISGLDL
ncbi:flavodoxin [Amedibacterium intestinale]|uniref:flavodoxin n=1 Tax=Amedibacterium intestinale TaxID=2583452 RepID=UPI000E1FB5FD